MNTSLSRAHCIASIITAAGSVWPNETVIDLSVIINREPTPMDGIADLVINRPIGETMSAVMVAMEERR